ncbi:MAG TPA: ABC transporter permease [Pseudonocardiaceae bacterium]|jgi:oleandomycin transport system permease protein|nr:ABC transporter permease [Pseudonocardiaceae bacterium]
MTTLTATMPAPRRVISPARALRHSLSLAGRSIIRIRKNPESLIDVTLQPILFLVMFVFLFGGAISGNWHSYLLTLVPGLMVQNTLFASMGTGNSLSTDISKGVFDRFRSLPISRSAPLVGAVLGDAVRFVVAMVVLLGFAMILGFRVHTNPMFALFAVLIMIAAGLALCWLGVWVGMLLTSPTAAQGVMVAVMMPLTFGSDVFVSSSTMPGWLQTWSSISPVSKLADVARGLMLGGPIAAPLLAAAIWMVGLAAVFFPLAMAAYRRRMTS